MSYIYVVQMNIPAEHEAEFNRVYDTEHVPMLSQVPGVQKVSRYRLEKTNDPKMQKYLAIYEVDSPTSSTARPGRKRANGAIGPPRSGPTPPNATTATSRRSRRRPSSKSPSRRRPGPTCQLLVWLTSGFRLSPK